MKHKVVVFGIDGVRLDALRTANTPRLDAIAAAGFLTAIRVPDVNPTISGPCWATIATGVHADTHNIHGNDLTGHHLDDHPCFLARASKAGHTSYAAAGWLPLLTDYSGGPIFRPDHQYTPPRPGGSSNGGDATSDQATIDNACRTLTDVDIDIAFIYIGQVDEIGHHQGTGDAYTSAIENADTCVGQILDTLTARPDEQWTILAVTDHGHRDGGGHGGDSDLERTAWIAGAGPGITTNTGNGINHADIPRLALTPLGVD
ncbi:MAG: alkaline phosphatase family protein [Stackebrandtia sp.]